MAEESTLASFVSSPVYLVISYLVLSFALWLIIRKLTGKKDWRAWFPGLRYIAWGYAMEMPRDGWFMGVVDVLLRLSAFLNIELISERYLVLVSLLQVVLAILDLVYGIRLFLRLLRTFGLRKLWLLLWFPSSTLTLLILGLGKRYRCTEVANSEEEWKAGVHPADLYQVGPSDMSDAGLSIDLHERVARDFGKKRYLLKDISLNIPNGNLVLLLGGSGSGKTTFVNAVIGYEKADARVLLNGIDVYKHYDRVKYRIGFVPQQNLIRGNDTVRRTVDDAARLRLPARTHMRERNDKVNGVMDLLGLAAGSDGLVVKKSGGQLRRISIAMELVSDPELFVLDEPDSGLDGVIARELFEKLRSVADEGRIVIVITHSPDRVIDLFDKVIVLARDSGRVGRLAFYGTPDEARAFFEKDTMEGIVMSVNRPEEGGEGRADELIERFARSRYGEPKEVSAHG